MIADVIFAIVIAGSFLVIITILLILMIKRINVLSKKNFNDKLQEYDSLIDEREKQVSDLENSISTKQAELEELDDRVKDLNEELDEKGSANSGLPLTLVSGNAVMEKEDVIRNQYHKIRSEFSFDKKGIVSKFIQQHPISESDRKRYEQCQQINSKLDEMKIFKVLSMPKKQQAAEFRKMFSREEIKILDELPGGQNDPKGFNLQKNLRSFKGAYRKADPTYYVYVPYIDADNMGSSEDVQIVRDDHITEGFRIMHHGKIYDYSI